MTTFDQICGLPLVERPTSPMHTVVVQRPQPHESTYEFLRRVREEIAEHRMERGQTPKNLYLSAFPKPTRLEFKSDVPRELASEIPFTYPQSRELDIEFSPSQITPAAIAALFGVPLDVLGLTEEGKPMNLKQQLQAQIDRASERLTRLERFPPDDTFADGTIIGFDRQFTPDGKIYHYAGVKTPKGWFITGGQHNEAFRWDQLVQMLAEEGECLNLVVCAEVEELIEPIVGIEIEQAEADDGDGLMEQS